MPMYSVCVCVVCVRACECVTGWVVTDSLPPKVGKAIFYMQHVPKSHEECNACPQFRVLYFANSHTHTLYYTKLITSTARPIDCAPVHIFFVILHKVLRPTERRQCCTVGCGHAAARFYVTIVAFGGRWHAGCSHAYINLICELLSDLSYNIEISRFCISRIPALTLCIIQN